MADRQKIIETNRSLRLIKNELENLLEKGVISDAVFDSINSQLPAESPLAGHPAPAARSTASTPVQAPTSALAGLSVGGGHQHQHEPPSYSQSTGAASTNGPPVLPTRNAAPPPPPGKPVIAQARALYRYTASDARDCSFERDDRVAVYEYMNADWWMGRNERTGQEGIFPKNYVEVDPAYVAAAAPPPMAMVTGPGGYPSEKAGYNGYQAAAPPPAQPAYTPVPAGYPPPPPQQNPYNASVPPMAVAEQGGGSNNGGGGKAGEMGKKFGKKLGNAAIFGAGATLGGNLVNSIF